MVISLWCWFGNSAGHGCRTGRIDPLPARAVDQNIRDARAREFAPQAVDRFAAVRACLTANSDMHAPFVGQRLCHDRELPGDQVGQDLVVEVVEDVTVCLQGIAPSPQGGADGAKLSVRRVPAQNHVTMVGHGNFPRFLTADDSH
jgi:hypothetical protein